ncbi:L-seryl-tRNA(Sec) selenium transferase [Metallumcola ferriviriculae]|uniref:L-seryl-tRNA(Sec) selenium transferase n=1 Tax=Metallumcola ferriviriculae TaxID=3039180 RepID=A0AAU0UIZ3_9FIRM|nr:L-seryl-tRNA(Sec) selenium transferase [Desulfitibacteraceae bacterium MK1]
MNNKELLKELPAVNDLLTRPKLVAELQRISRDFLVDVVREVLEKMRQQILSGGDALPAVEEIERQVLALIEHKTRPKLRKVINATGVVLHTNLGRAVLSEQAIKAVADTAAGYSNLEFDLDAGQRGSRHSHVENLLTQVTGAPAAMVVNNNAAAVLLVLSALAKSKEVIVSRGELVEIGGAFRVPEVMEQSGAILREVGATNKTYLRDYQAAITDQTGLLLKVHTSNYKVVGFTHETSRRELVELGRKHAIPVVEDLGSGSLIALQSLGIDVEPTVQDCLKAGIDLVTFSGDKLLGGPQAGFIVGRHDLVQFLKRHPLARAIRVDKMTIAALEATLRAYLDPDQAQRQIPTLKMLMESPEKIKHRAQSLADRLKREAPRYLFNIIPGKSRPGGGALPTTELDTWLVEIKGGVSSSQLAGRLRQGEPAVLVRIQQDSIILDPRTLLPGEDEKLSQAFSQCIMG